MNDKLSLMKKLIELYEQLEFITSSESKITVGECIKRTEDQLSKILTENNNEDWIYSYFFLDNCLEQKVKEIEDVLGFKLFRWQKSYIERGIFRCYGATTAKILRDIINGQDKPSFLEGNTERQHDFYKKEFKRIKTILHKTEETIYEYERLGKKRSGNCL